MSYSSLKNVASPLLIGLAALGVSFSLLASPKLAHAQETPFCPSVNVAASKWCVGANRRFNALWAVGNQRSLCVLANQVPDGTRPLGPEACSTGAGQPVYLPEPAFYMEYPMYPEILNSNGGPNLVYGISFKP